MNDFDYEIMQRKRIAQSARHKKNGAKSKKCTLPSDGMTQKQWKERNGEVMTYNLSKPMRWEKFKYLREDVQKEYLEKLIAEYGARCKEIADMLGVAKGTLSNFCTRRGWHLFAHTGGAMKKAAQQKWDAFLNGEEIAEEVTDVAQVENVPAPAKEEAVLSIHDITVNTDDVETVDAELEAKIRAAEHQAKAVNQMQLNSFTLQFSGEFNPDTIRNTLVAILGGGMLVQVEVKCTVEG